jgi:Zn finger protein HypA/HybF involved in hydrogenase expression
MFSIIEKCASFSLKRPDYLADIFSQAIYAQQILKNSDIDGVEFHIKNNVMEADDKTLIEYLKYNGFTATCPKCNEKNTLILKKDYDDLAKKGIQIE